MPAHFTLHPFLLLLAYTASRTLQVKHSLIPKLVGLLKEPPFRGNTLRILYHLSMDDRCKSMFTYTEAIPVVLQLAVNFPQNVVAKELVGLAVNLTHNHRNAELMCGEARGQGLTLLVQRVARTQDASLLKVVRNISAWTESRSVHRGCVDVGMCCCFAKISTHEITSHDNVKTFPTDK